MNRKRKIEFLNLFGTKVADNATDSDVDGLFSKLKHVQIKSRNHTIDLVCKNDSDGDDDDGEETAEMMIYAEVGKDPWGDGTGIDANDVARALDAISSSCKVLNVYINSPGGLVMDAMAIRSRFLDWDGTINQIVDGVSASCATWMVPADTTKARSHAQLYIHDALAYVVGNEEDLIKAAGELGKTSDQIAQIYSDMTGNSKKKMRELMRAGTLMTAEEAKELGFVDEVLPDKAVKNFTVRQLNSMRKVLDRQAAILNSAATKAAGNENNNEDKVMKKDKMIALLNKWGVTLTGNETEEQLIALVEAGKPAPAQNAAPAKPAEPTAAELAAKLEEQQKNIEKLTNLNKEAKKQEVTVAIDKLIADDKLQANLRDEAINDCVANPDRLEKFYNKLAPKAPGGPSLSSPIAEAGVSGGEASLQEINKYSKSIRDRFQNNFTGALGAAKLSEYGPDEVKKIMAEVGMENKKFAAAIRKHKNKLIAAWNTNNIDAGLQRQLILQEMLEEFAVVLLPLTSFSTVFSNVPLEGTDKVDVPFYPLQTAASQSFAAATGYNTLADTNTNTREVAIGGDGVTAAAANTARARKYIGMAFSSYELRRQPWVNWEKLARQNANKLGVDIFTDIVSSVVNAANFGASVKAVAPQLFSADDIADLCENATGRNWPVINRALTLNHTYRTPLLKDATFKQYLSYGSTDPIRKAMIQEAYGFEDINIVPNLSNYSPAGENLQGWINWRYAVLIATAPIMPTEEVRALMTRYDLATDPQMGITLEYRRFGDTTLDKTKEVVECSYGAAKGVASALARITSA